MHFLENAIGDALPDRWFTELREWAAQLDRLAVRRVTFLEVDNPDTLTNLSRAYRVRESI